MTRPVMSVALVTVMSCCLNYLIASFYFWLNEGIPCDFIKITFWLLPELRMC